MVKFRISLDLFNYDNIKKKYRKKKILRYYKTLANIIRDKYNSDVKQTNAISKKNYGPLIKIKKTIFNEPDIDAGEKAKKSTKNKKVSLDSIMRTIFPPSMNIDIQYTMSVKREELAIKQFCKSYMINVKKDYKDLRSMYYSSKIVRFVVKVRELINDNILWQDYMEDNNLKTDYVPVISVSDAAIISLS
jgi:uncharacterized protein (UPF0335 family)